MKRKSNTLKKQKTSMTNKKEVVKGKKEEVLPSTANTLYYQALYQNGLMQVKEDYFSQSYLLGDVNYQTVGLEDKGAIIEKYSDLINSLDDQTNFQLTIFNKRLNLEKFRQSVLYEEKEDGYDSYRKELNRMMNQNLDSGENNFSAVKLITFGRKDSNPKQAYRSLSQIGEYFKSGFSEIDARFESLAGENRVNLLADMLRGEHHLPFSYRDLTRSGQTTRHFIAPNLLDFKNKNYLQINDRLLQIVYVRDYGMELGDQFIRDLMQGDLELIVSLHAQSSTKADAMKKLRTKKTLMESQKIGEQQKLARTGIYLEKVGHVLESNIDEAEELLKTMTETGDKLFQTVFLIGVFGQDEEELKQALDTIQQVAGSNDLMIDKLPYMQEAAFNSLLPFGCDFLEGVSRSLLTSNVAVNSPWTSVDLQDRSGKYYGINQISSNIITIDRSLLNTPSGLILGTSGAGKGMATKHEIITTKIKESGENTEIIIVDPEAEYSVIGRAFGGEMIDIAPDSQTYLNVLDLSEENMDEDPVKVKSEFLLSFIGKLLDRKMDGREKSIIDRVTRLTYQSFKEPSLEEWVFVLSQQPEEEAQNLALDMELYVEGSLDIFSHKTNIQTGSNFLIYNVKKLGDELKQIALMVVFDQIWNRVVRNQKLGKKTWIYFDEMQLLLLDKYASDF
ncbi:VirB4-like conjugal transfer ATPase, CD1110 family, partial [Streptococcus pneumoniae]